MLQLYAGSAQHVLVSMLGCVVCQHFLTTSPEARSDLQHVGSTEQTVEMLLVLYCQRHTLPPLIFVWL